MEKGLVALLHGTKLSLKIPILLQLEAYQSNIYLLSAAVSADPNSPTPITKSTTSMKPTVPSKTTISSDGTTYFTVPTLSTTLSTESSTVAATTNLTVGSQQSTESTILLGKLSSSHHLS